MIRFAVFWIVLLYRHFIALNDSICSVSDCSFVKRRRLIALNDSICSVSDCSSVKFSLSMRRGFFFVIVVGPLNIF